MSQAWNLLKAQEHMTSYPRDAAQPLHEGSKIQGYPQSIDPNVASMAGREKADSNQHRIESSQESRYAREPKNRSRTQRLQGFAAKQAEYGNNPLNASSDREFSGGWHGTPEQTLNERNPEYEDSPANNEMRGGEDAIEDIRNRVQRMPRPGERGAEGHVGVEDTSQSKEQEPQDPYDARNYNMGYDPQLQQQGQGQQQQQLGQRSPLQLQQPQQ